MKEEEVPPMQEEGRFGPDPSPPEHGDRPSLRPKWRHLAHHTGF